MAENIFTLDIPKEVYIVGSSPNAPKEVKTIPPDAFVIVCNAAVLLDCPKNLWFVFDERIIQKKWWNKVSTDPPCPRVFGYERNRLGEREYEFKFLPKFRDKPKNTEIPGVLRGGGTIGGCAVQFAIQKKCTKIHLIGFSMEEASDFTGAVAPERKRFGGKWQQRDTFNMILNNWGENVIWSQKKEVDCIGCAPSALLWTPTPGRLTIGCNGACDLPGYLGLDYIIDIGTHFDAAKKVTLPPHCHTNYKMIFVARECYKRYKSYYDALEKPLRVFTPVTHYPKISIKSIPGNDGSASILIALAVLSGAERIYLWGLDMDGKSDKYFNGEKTHSAASYYGGRASTIFNKLINQVKALGVEVYKNGEKI